ncbi:hypothetical protein [Litorimonas sp. WD9-15]|uniref:hypothetical protein n=1 Tax=Litorimonas sp. WD9-15 TaxID=3418716 RepID=UPI003D06B493
MKTIVKTCLGAAMALGFAASASAQSADFSPVLLIESGPSDNPEYRRMVFVKYLAGNSVSVNYRAYNRTEFTQVPNTTPSDVIRACANGAASNLSDIRAFERAEASRERNRQAPEVTRFCIKNVPNWEGGGRTTWLDPIFNGLPYAASLNN